MKTFEATAWLYDEDDNVYIAVTLSGRTAGAARDRARNALTPTLDFFALLAATLAPPATHQPTPRLTLLSAGKDARLTLAQCRALIAPATLTDEALGALVDTMYELGGLILDAWSGDLHACLDDGTGQ